jgi:hypothetical protein
MEKYFNNFKGKLTKTYIYLESLNDSNFVYRISGKKLFKLWKLLHNPKLKLIPVLKQLKNNSYFNLETRTTKNKITNNWLWVPGYQRNYDFPKTTLGGLSFNGTLFSGEFDDETSFPIMLGRNRNSQNTGALKGMKTKKSIEDIECQGKWSTEELEWLRREERRAEEKKYDLRQRCENSQSRHL